MRKVTKIFLSTVSSLILLAITIPVTVWLLLFLPPVQDMIVRRASDSASRTLGTTVTFDRVRIGLFNSATIEGVYVEDYDRDTLLHVGRFSAVIDPLALLRREVELTDVRFSDGTIRLKRYPDGQTNAGRLLSKFRSEDPFRVTLRAASVKADGMAVTYNDLAGTGTSEGMDFGDLAFSDIVLRAQNLSVTGDSVSVGIGELSLREKCGFRLDGFSSDRVVVAGGGVRMGESRIRTPDSELLVDHAYLDKTGGRGLADFMNDIRVDVRIRGSALGLQTAGYFIPAARKIAETLRKGAETAGGNPETGRNGAETAVKGSKQGRKGAETAAKGSKQGRKGAETARRDAETLRNLNLAITGKPSDLSGWLTASALDDTNVSMFFAARGLPDIANTDFSFALDSLATGADDIRRLLGIGGAALNDTVSRRIDDLGKVTLKGNFTGRIHNFTARADLRTAHGSGGANLVIKPSARGGRTEFAGELNTRNLEPEALFGFREIGRVSFSSHIDGSLGGGYVDANMNAELSGLEYNGYDYHGITMDGRVRGKQFLGLITSRDPNLDLDFDGLIDLSDSIPAYNFVMELRNADLAALNFNRRDSVSQVSFAMRAAGTGDRLDNLNGEIRIDNMLYVNHIDSIRTGRIIIAGRNDGSGRSLTLTSDFADASFRSGAEYARLGEQLKGALSPYLPSLSPRSAATVSPCGPDETSSTLTVEVKEANNVAGIFVPGLIIAKGTKITAVFDPDGGKFSLAANSDYIELGNSFVSRLTVDAHNRADSLTLAVAAGEVYAGGFLLPDFRVSGGARNDAITLGAGFENPEKGQSARIAAEAWLLTDSLGGNPMLSVGLSPSYYEQGGRRWNMSADRITAGGGRVEVGGFLIEGDGQSLRVSGAASDDPGDVIRIDVDNFDINPISPVLNAGYQFHGRASGYALLHSPVANPLLNARIDFRDMRIDHVQIPPLTFFSEWDADNSRVRMVLIEKDGTLPVVSATYIPSTKRIDGIVRVTDADLSLLNVHYEGTLSRTEGRADLNARLSGYGRRIKLDGTVDLKEYRSTVDFLNVSYSTIGTPQIILAGNVLRGRAIPIADPEGNRGTIDMEVDLNKLNNVDFDFGIHIDNMMLLNTSQADNELFYGKVYGSGSAEIKGDKRGVNMNITVSTGDNSRFYMPLEEKSDMRDADFVRFVRPRARETADTAGYNVRKRLLMNREQTRRRIKSSGDINTNITLAVKPNTLVELLIDPQTGHTVRGRGNGTVNMHINPLHNEFTMYGDYQITEGIYLFTLENIIEKPFIIEPGSHIQWTGDPIDALLNISGVYRLKSSIGAAVSNTGFEDWRMRIPIECRIMLSDRLSLPTITFNITAPGATPEVQNLLAGFLNTQEMMATQFFFLLATGSFYDYEGSTGNIGAAAGSATAFEFLSNQFSNWISSDRFNIGIRYRPQTETTSDEWGVDFSQQLLDDRLLLEIEGSYDTRNNEHAVYSENMKNFTGDFYLTGLLNQTGNLKAKLFSRTISRFDENQGLQEWGTGIYYSEDFNTFGEVLRKFRERLTGKNRRKKPPRRAEDAEKDGMENNISQANEKE